MLPDNLPYLLIDDPEQQGARHHGRILIAAAADILVDVIRFRREGAGHRVISAPGGEAAYAQVCKAPPDLPVPDAMMPILSGAADYLNAEHRQSADLRLSARATTRWAAVRHEGFGVSNPAAQAAT